MKYFTREMWRQTSEGFSDSSDKLWKKKHKLYETQFSRIKSKLPREFISYLASSEGHRNGDYVVDARLENNGKLYLERQSKDVLLRNRKGIPSLIDVTLTVICPTGYFYFLKYKGVKKYVLDFPSDNPLWYTSTKDLGEWGYDEVNCPKKGVFRHGILMHSGATILIDFQDFSFRRKKIDKSKVRNTRWQNVLKSLSCK